MNDMWAHLAYIFRLIPSDACVAVWADWPLDRMRNSLLRGIASTGVEWVERSRVGWGGLEQINTWVHHRSAKK